MPIYNIAKIVFMCEGGGEMEIKRDSILFNSFVRNYWEYYRELEKEFLHTRKYIEYSLDNFSSYSIEFLKLYQAVCSEVDVVGKVLARVANAAFKPDDKKNNIYKWWYEIQDRFFLIDGPFTYMNSSVESARYSLTEYRCLLMDEIEIHPWNKFRIEKVFNSVGHINHKLVQGFQVPTWWSEYNKVKHNRIVSIGSEMHSINYPKANFGNVCNAFAALYILEKSFMDMIGTDEDLSCFMDYSDLFIKPKRYTCKQMDELFKVTH